MREKTVMIRDIIFYFKFYLYKIDVEFFGPRIKNPKVKHQITWFKEQNVIVITHHTQVLHHAYNKISSYRQFRILLLDLFIEYGNDKMFHRERDLI